MSLLSEYVSKNGTKGLNQKYVEKVIAKEERDKRNNENRNERDARVRRNYAARIGTDDEINYAKRTLDESLSRYNAALKRLNDVSEAYNSIAAPKFNTSRNVSNAQGSRIMAEYNSAKAEADKLKEEYESRRSYYLYNKKTKWSTMSASDLYDELEATNKQLSEIDSTDTYNPVSSRPSEQARNAYQGHKYTREYEDLEVMRNTLQNQYYYPIENEEQFAKLRTDTKASSTYDSLNSLQSDIDIIYDLMGSSDSDTNLYHRNAKYNIIRQKYGEDAIKDMDSLLQTLTKRQKDAADAFEAETGYDYFRMEGYRKTKEAAAEYQSRIEQTKDSVNSGFGSAVLNNVGRLVASPAQGIEALFKTTASLGHNDPNDIKNYVPMNPYDMPITSYVRTVDATSAENIQNYVTKKLGNTKTAKIIGEGATFLYQTGMSMAESLTAAYTLGPITAVAFGGNAAAQYMQEAAERGNASNKQIIEGAFLAGTAEALFEYVSLENLDSIKNARSAAKGIKAMLMQGGIEASEEIATEISNIITDNAVMRGVSENSLAVKNYMAQGISRKEAEKRVWLDNIKNVALAGAGGFLSGFSSAGTVEAVNKIQGNSGYKQLSRLIDDEDSTQNLIDSGLESDENTKSYKLAKDAQQKIESGGKLTQREITNLLKANDEAIARENNDTTDELRFYGDKLMLSEDAKNRMVAAYFTSDANIDAFTFAKEYTIAYENAKKGIDTKFAFNNKYTPHLTNEAIKSAYTAGAVEESRSRLETIRNGEYNAEIKEGDENYVTGEAIYLRQSQERNDGQNPAGRIRTMEESAGEQFGTRPRDSEAAQIIYDGREVTPFDLGVTGGSSSAGVYAVANANNSKTVVKALDYAAKRGVKVILFGGGNMRIKENGTEFEANGAHKGNTVWVRVDDPNFDAYQIVRHELGHDMIEKGEADPIEVRKRLEAISKGDIDAVAAMYAAVYKDSGYTPEQIWHEVICDSLGDMNIFDSSEILSDEEKALTDVVQSAAKVEALSEAINAESASTKTANANEQSYSRYQTIKLSKTAWDVLNSTMDAEIETSDKYLDSATKWLYKTEKGTNVFAVYGIGDGTVPTPLYAVSGKKAVQAYNNLNEWEEYNGNIGSWETFSRRLAVNRSKTRNTSNGIRNARNGRAENRDVRISEQKQDSDRNADTGGSTENSGNGINSNTTFSRAFDSDGKQLSESQQEYFKNSKVRDKNGRIKPVYHGTTGNFTIFYERSFFTDDYWNADGYANGENVYEVYLKIDKPLVIDCNGRKWDKLDTEYGASTRDVVANLDTSKYDGVIFENINDSWIDDEEAGDISTVYVPVSSNQIKNVDNLNPTENEDIRYSRVINKDGQKHKPIYKRKPWSESESLFMQWENGSAPDGEIKTFFRFGKAKYYQKTQSGCVEISRAQYAKLGGYNGENTYRRAERKVSDSANKDGRRERTVPGHIDGDRNTGNDEIVLRKAKSLADAARSVSSSGRNADGVYNDLTEKSRVIDVDRAILKNAADNIDRANFTKAENDALDIVQRRIVEIENVEKQISDIREKENLDIADKNRVAVLSGKRDRLNKELLNITDKNAMKALTSKVNELLVKEYGSIAPGENPAREVSVPKRTNKGNRVSQTVRTAAEAKVTTDEMSEELAEAVIKGNFSYAPITDEDANGYAESTIENKGWDTALRDWTADIRSGKISKNSVALGFALYNNAVTAGDTKTAVDILTDLTARVREGAQAVQAVRLLKKLSPEHRLYSIQKSVNALQEDVEARYGDKAGKITLDPKLVENYNNAETDVERSNAEKALYENIARQLPHTFIDKWNSWRYLAMLGNPRTHIRNIVGNAGFSLVRMPKNAIAAALESAFDIKNRTTSLLNLAKESDRNILSIARDDYSTIADQITGAGKFNDAVSKIESMKPAFGSSKLAAPLNFISDVNSSLLDREDVWFSKPAYAHALARYMKANGITAESWGNLDAAKKDAARAWALEEAQKATYRDFNDFSNAASSLGRKSSNNKVVKAAQTLMEGILPFRRTPANILKRGVEYSPVGLVKGLYQAAISVKQGKATAAEAIDRIASGLTGTGLLMLGALLAKSGVLTPGRDDDDKQAQTDELTGKQNYALSIGDYNVTLDWLAPEALPLFVGAEFASAFENSENENWLPALFQGITRISEPMLEMSMLSSLQDVIENVSYSDSKLIGILTNGTVSYLTQALPTVFGQVERVTETERETTWTDRNKTSFERDIDYLIAKVANKLPGEYNQIPYIDAWGRTEDTGTVLARVFNNLFNPAYISKDITTPVDEELQRLYELGYTDVYPSATKQSDKIGGEYLSVDEYVRYATERGQQQFRLISDITSSSWYAKMSDGDKADIINTAYEYVKYVAQDLVKPGEVDIPKWVKEARDSDNLISHLLGKSYDDAKERFVSGDISRNEAFDILTKYENTSADDAQKKIDKWEVEKDYGFTYDDLKDEYANGNISAQKAEDILVKYGGVEREDARIRVETYDWQNEGYDIDTNQTYIIEKYREFCEPVGIDKRTYMDYRDKTVPIKGSRKEPVMAIINSLPLTYEQKDALYYYEGWAESKIYEAPWH